MSDQPSISYSYQTTVGQQPATGNDDLELYAFVDCELVPTGDHSTLIIHKHKDAQLTVSPEVTTAMASCGVYRTLAEHVEHLCSTIPQLAGQQANVSQVLNMVKDAGLFTTASETCERLCPPDVPAAVDLPATRVFIITCDRPAAVERLLTSMLHAGDLSRHEQMFLIDDSRDPQNAARNQELVETFNLTSPRDMRYFGSEHRDQLLADLVKALPEHEAGIRFLIDREHWQGKATYGLARTLALLLSVDRRAIVMDDDVICAAVKTPLPEEGISFANAGRDIDFYPSEETMIAQTERAEFSPLTAHAQYVGVTLGQALNQLGADELSSEQLEGSNAGYLSQWTSNSQVLITQCGTVGDPGSPSTTWIYESGGDTARRVLAQPGGLQGALSNRYYWMGHSKPGFSKLAVISQVTGLNNAYMLPPYFPVFRGEDYLFGAMTEYLHPHSAVMHFDWGIPHLPIEARKGDPAEPPRTGRGALNWPKCITDQARYDQDVSTEVRLESLIALIREAAQTSDHGLITRYRREVAENLSGQAGRLNALIAKETQLPGEWLDWLQKTAENFNTTLASVARLQDYSGVEDSATDEAILGQFRAYASGFADALAAWPAMREAAGNWGYSSG